jgi:hypothetical protein
MSEDRIEGRIKDALKALREADDGQEAGPEVEARLMAAFRKHRARHVWKRAAAAVTMLTAAAAVILAIVMQPRPTAVRPVEPVVIVTPQPEPRPAVIPATPSPRRAPHRQPAALREIATEFFPLLDVQPPFERGELVRMTVPASAMRDVGLPVSQDHLADMVQADVLVGQEGLARAIRFVGFEK